MKKIVFIFILLNLTTFLSAQLYGGIELKEGFIFDMKNDITLPSVIVPSFRFGLNQVFGKISLYEGIEVETIVVVNVLHPFFAAEYKSSGSSLLIKIGGGIIADFGAFGSNLNCLNGFYGSIECRKGIIKKLKGILGLAFITTSLSSTYGENELLIPYLGLLID